jgi:hypothetical protein
MLGGLRGHSEPVRSGGQIFGKHRPLSAHRHKPLDTLRTFGCRSRCRTYNSVRARSPQPGRCSQPLNARRALGERGFRDVPVRVLTRPTLPLPPAKCVPQKETATAASPRAWCRSRYMPRCAGESAPIAGEAANRSTAHLTSPRSGAARNPIHQPPANHQPTTARVSAPPNWRFHLAAQLRPAGAPKPLLHAGFYFVLVSFPSPVSVSRRGPSSHSPGPFPNSPLRLWGLLHFPSRPMCCLCWAATTVSVSV